MVSLRVSLRDREHLLEHRLKLDVHFHRLIAQNADDRRALFGLKLDRAIFKLTGAELFAELVAGVFMTLFGRRPFQTTEQRRPAAVGSR